MRYAGRTSRQWIAVVVLGVVCGCKPLVTDPIPALQDEDPGVRLRGIAHAGQTKDPRTIPYLVDRLTDPDPEVRFYAILALERITGRTMGYRYYDPPPRRSSAERRWRQWLIERGGGSAPTTQPADAEKP